eukprot:333084-Pyramimonas_sp.AAC.1
MRKSTHTYAPDQRQPKPSIENEADRPPKTKHPRTRRASRAANRRERGARFHEKGTSQTQALRRE